MISYIKYVSVIAFVAIAHISTGQTKADEKGHVVQNVHPAKKASIIKRDAGTTKVVHIAEAAAAAPTAHRLLKASIACQNVNPKAVQKALNATIILEKSVYQHPSYLAKRISYVVKSKPTRATLMLAAAGAAGYAAYEAYKAYTTSDSTGR